MFRPPRHARGSPLLCLGDDLRPGGALGDIRGGGRGAAQQRPLRPARRDDKRSGPKRVMISPSVSIKATSTPSCEVPLISPIARTGGEGCGSGKGHCTCSDTALIAAVLRLNRRPDLLHQPPAASDGESPPARSRKNVKLAVDEHLQVRFSQRPRRAEDSFTRSPSPRRWMRSRVRSNDHRLYRFRLHRAVAACRLALADHDALLAAADRPPADRADGRRHHARRRSLRQGREPAASDRRDDRRKPQGHPRRSSPNS